MKSSGNSKNIGLHYPFSSNVGPHPQNAKLSNVLLRRRISEVRVNLVICISLGLLYIFVVFGATVCKTVRPMLSDRCLSVCPVCNVRALWPNSWTDQDETWHAGRPRPWPHYVRWGPNSPLPKKGTEPDAVFTIG